MKKIKIAGLLLMCFVFSKPVFSQAFDDGTNLINIGFGLPAGTRITRDFEPYKKYTDYKFKNYGTVILKYEHGLHKYFGIGLNLEYSGSSANYKYDDNANIAAPRYLVTIKGNAYGFYARFNAHLPIGDKLDFYGGAGLGYFYTVNTKTDTNPNANTNIQQKSTVLDFDYQLTLGARFMVKDNVGVFVETGRATTAFQLGLVLKF